jgi:hypothetical protein
MQKYISFLEAESIALNLAYKQFFGEGNPVGIAFTFINDKKAGNPWTEDEKAAARYISQTAIRDLYRANITKLITSGSVPDCLMARRFMATGSGYTTSGHIF